MIPAAAGTNPETNAGPPVDQVGPRIVRYYVGQLAGPVASSPAITA